jgi:hypothetical protein
MNNFIKVVGYKINLQKSISFLFTNNEQIEEEYRKKNPSKKKIKYLRINLTKYVNELYKEDYKLLKKEIEEDYGNWKNLPFSWIGRITW